MSNEASSVADAGVAETVGIGWYFEDYRVGRRYQTLGRTITEGDIVNFVCLTGMLEELFTNVDYIERESVIKGRVAPGALVYTFAEGLVLPSTLQRTGIAFLGMDFKVSGPSFAGDTIYVACEVIVARLTSKPGRGIVTTRNEVRNQRGELVLTYTPTRMLKMRETAK